MKVLKYLLFIALGLGTLWILLCLFAKDAYRIERSMEIEAPTETVYEQVRLFKNFTNWSPWHFMDPDMKISIEGPDGEVGTVYRWDSNDKRVGKGYQKILTATPGRLEYEVDFGLGVSPSFFSLKGDSSLTTITWVLDMHLPFLMRAGGMLTDINTYVGKDYENGLANLKKYCEALNPKKYRGFKVLEVERDTIQYAMIRQEVDFQDISTFFGTQIPIALEASNKAGATMKGLPTGLFWQYDTVAMKTDMAVAIPLEKPMKSIPELELLNLGGKALVVYFLGNFALTAEAHAALEDYMADKKLQSIPPVLEEYVTDPSLEPDTAKWLTRVIYFVTAKVDSTAMEQ